MRDICELLALIERHDTDYAARYPLLLEAVAVAASLGMAAGFRLDPDEPDWLIAYIALPTGQVSWHCPQYPEPWDGHSTAEKYRRCHEACDD
ncbi:MAG: hypothetical protein ACTHMJ_19835 [Thermomicrobiales bacterium]